MSETSQTNPVNVIGPYSHWSRPPTTARTYSHKSRRKVPSRAAILIGAAAAGAFAHYVVPIL